MKNCFCISVLFLLFTSFIYSQNAWYKYDDNPVLTSGSSGNFDEYGAAFCSILNDGSLYKMWYTGINGNAPAIGYATSPDGINWNKYSGNLVLDSAAMPSVIYDGDSSIYKMWYTYGPGPTPDTNWRIGYATSSDGIHWTKYSDNPVLDLGSSGEWDDYQIGETTVIVEDSIYKMWYHGGRAYSSGSIGYATSTDGINWTKYDDPQTSNPPFAESDPVIVGTQAWESTVVQWPNVIFNNSTSEYEMLYAGLGNLTGQRFGYAASTDGVVWKKNASPVLSIGSTGQFDDGHLLAPYVTLGSDQIYRMWYTGLNTSQTSYAIGYATDNHLVVPSSPIFYGDTVNLGNGIAYTWVEVDSENVPLRIGLTLTEGALSNLPGVLRMMSLDFPMVTNDSLFKHMLFDWEPNGHPPGSIYGVPHFDFHFYMISRSERILIPGGSDPFEIPEAFMPEDYIAVPGLGITSIPQMGVHYVDSLAEELNGSTFKNTLIYGFSKAEMIFIEPMITLQHLLSYQNEELPIKQPAEYQKTGYYPTSYGVNFDSTNNLYKIYLTDFVFKNGPTSINEITSLVPEKFILYQNYPNPFNPSTTINWQSPVSGYQTLKVYDLLGREVATIVDEYKPAGSYEVEFDASKLSSGTYFYRLTAGDFVETKKLILMK